MRLRTSSGGLRPALTLLEVIVALVIFILAAGAIGHLLNLSQEQVLLVKLHSQAARLCQSKMAEVVGGATPLQSQGDTPFDEDGDWTYSLDCSQSSSPSNLWTVKVTVRPVHDTSYNLEETLTQMVIAPSARGNQGDAAAAAAANSSSSTNSSGGGASAGGGSSP